jgi:polyisoprenoid-binding protein YceI
VNNQVSCVFDANTNRIVAKVLVKAFEFDKALMQKHFNENYLESDKYPKASFKGKIKDAENINFGENWNKNLEFEGDLTIHGITRSIGSPVEISMKNGQMKINCIFYITLKDYEIKIPSTVINNVAEKVKISVNLEMYELKN